MAEVIGIASGVLTLAEAAFATSSTLISSIKSFRDQPENLRELDEDVRNIRNILQAIQTEASSTSAPKEKLDSLEAPLRSCEKIYQELLSLLDRCPCFSRNGQRSIRDWFRLENYHSKRFDELREQLKSLKSTITVTMQMVHMLDAGSTNRAVTKLLEDVEHVRKDIHEQLRKLEGMTRDSTEAETKAFNEHRELLDICLETLNKEEEKMKLFLKVYIERNEANEYAVQTNTADRKQLPANLELLRINGNRAALGATQVNGLVPSEIVQSAFLNRPEIPPLAMQAVRSFGSDTRSTTWGPGINNSPFPPSSSAGSRSGRTSRSHQPPGTLQLEKEVDGPNTSCFGRQITENDDFSLRPKGKFHDLRKYTE